MRLGTVALTLAFGLGVVGLVAADEPEAGSWFSRTFPLPWAKTPAEAEKSKKTDPSVPTGPSSRERQAKADAALARRRDVCQRLREIAFEIGDDHLSRKADELDQRAWDVHVAAMNRIQSSDTPSAEPADKKKEGRK